jgi:hypothetical protein
MLDALSLVGTHSVNFIPDLVRVVSLARVLTSASQKSAPNQPECVERMSASSFTTRGSYADSDTHEAPRGERGSRGRFVY